MNKKSLPYGLEPHELIYLVLLGTAFYVSQANAATASLVGHSWRALVFGAALIGGVPVLIWRCRDEWRQLPNRWFFLSLAAAWAALFNFLGNATFDAVNPSSLFRWIYNIDTSVNVDEQHGLLIPFVVLALYWWKRKELVAQPAGLWWPAIGLLIVALGLHFIGFVSEQQRLSVIAFFLGLYALTGLAWGRHWMRRSLFPFFLFAFCVPVAEFMDPLTMRLRLLVSRIVEMVAHLGLAPDLVRDGTQLFDAQHTFAYEVAAACSGIHSLMALTALATIYGFVVFREPWKRVVMMLIALPLALFGNVIRLCFTIAVAEAFGQGAGKAVETYAGFITFGVAIYCAYWIARWLENLAQTADQPATT
jgi:exosortase